MQDNGVSESLDGIARQLSKLGINGALTDIGAIEVLSKEIEEGTSRISESLGRIADGLHSIAEALQECKDGSITQG